MVGGILMAVAVLLVVDPPPGGVPVAELVAISLAVAALLTLFGRRYDIAVRILWALTGATFAVTLIHYSVACTALYQRPGPVLPPPEVWLVCAPAWPLFSTPMLTAGLLLLLLGVRDGFAENATGGLGPPISRAADGGDTDRHRGKRRRGPPLGSRRR